MNVAAVEAWLQAHAGLDAGSLGTGVVRRAARARIAATGCTSAADYVQRLEGSAEERHALIDGVVVPETWFFRDRPAMDSLARHVVDTWGPAHPGGTYRVLSVPCSTGEEPYSLAMAFALAGWSLEQLRIDAVDISRENLGRSLDGVYGRNAFRGGDLAFRERFMTAAGVDMWRVADRVRTPVNFAQGNVLADDFSFGRLPYDAIFCRNLLIYFDRASQARAIRTLDRLLSPEGWIAVGPAEPVLLFEHGYAALRVSSAFLLHRAPAPDAAPPATPHRPAAIPRTTAPRRTVLPRARAATPKRPTPTVAREVSLAELRRLADAGRLQEASRCGEALLAQQGPSVELFFLLAVVAEAEGQVAHAEALYRKALYLDPHHVEVLAHLALLADRHGDARGARAYRERAERARLKEAR